ncbi:MAG TPA: Dabb family protein [Polaromonas sp.]|nr:Dabb family protein [Polaromonas sp.]
MLESSFESVEALNTYLFHPLHQALIADLKPYFEWAAVDYTV